MSNHFAPHMEHGRVRTDAPNVTASLFTRVLPLKALVERIALMACGLIASNFLYAQWRASHSEAINVILFQWKAWAASCALYVLKIEMNRILVDKKVYESGQGYEKAFNERLGLRNAIPSAASVKPRLLMTEMSWRNNNRHITRRSVRVLPFEEHYLDQLDPNGLIYNRKTMSAFAENVTIQHKCER